MLLFKGDGDQTAEVSQTHDETIFITAHARKKRGRRALPKDLPRVDIIHDLSEDEKQCACGAHLTRFAEEVCEKLDYIPARLRVERHIRYKYPAKAVRVLRMRDPASRLPRPRCN